jgi:hypothetical protein
LNVNRALKYSEGTYKGQFKYNLFNGEGAFRYKNGDSYSGGWKNGLKHEKGQYITWSGQCYSGNWLAGKKCGVGAYISCVKPDTIHKILEYFSKNDPAKPVKKFPNINIEQTLKR